MLCYQVVAQFTFCQHKAGLVSAHIKKHHNAAAHLVQSGLLFGSGLKCRRFFATKKEAAQYISYLHAVYKNRIIPNPPEPEVRLPGGQLSLF